MPSFSYQNSSSKVVLFCAPDGNTYRVAPGGTVSGTYGASIPTTTQSGTTYTLQAGDVGSRIFFDNGSAITLTIPVLSTLGVGDQFVFEQTGAGQVTLSAASGVTIRSRSGSLALNGQWSLATLIYDGSNNWTLVGDLA